MMSFHRFNSDRSAYLIAKENKRNEKRTALAKRERKQFFIAAAVGVILIAAASFHAHRVLAAHVPDDMPASSIWILTGHDRDNNDKLGLWVGCRKSGAVDHCRIADERGALQYDGDMLPLAIHPDVVEDKDLTFAKLDPENLWVRGVNYDLPVPVLPLADGTQLVPVSDRDGLRKRLEAGDWLDGMRPALPAPAR